MSLSRFIEILRNANRETYIEDLLDAIWLAQQPGTIAAHGTRSSSTLPAIDAQAQESGSATTPITEGREPRTSTGREASRAPTEDSSPIYAAPSRDAIPTGKASPVVIPAGRALQDRLSLARSLRPFRKRWPSRRETEIDEQQTVEATADLHGFFFPVVRPSLERWYHVDVVVEDDAGVDLWRDTVFEFCQMLRETGAFRDVRTWRLCLGGIGQTKQRFSAVLKNPAGGCVPAGFLDGRGSRRLIIFATHGSSIHWLDGTYGETLDVWCSTCSVLLLHLLPPHYWKRTPLGQAQAWCRAQDPGVPCSLLKIERRWWTISSDDSPESQLFIPVAPLSAEGLTEWANMQMARGRRCPAMLFEAEERKPVDVAPPNRTEADVERIIEAFRVESPQAFQLAVYLCSAAFTIPVARLVQEAKFGAAAGQSQLAEILLSGLVFARSTNEDPQNTYYDFYPEARQILLRSLRQADAESLADSLERHLSLYIERIYGRALSFRALVPDKKGQYQLPQWAQPFARLRASLRGIPGSHLDVRQLVSDFLNQVSPRVLRAVVDYAVSTKAEVISAESFDEEAWGALVSGGLVHRDSEDHWRFFPGIEALLEELAEQKGRPVVEGSEQLEAAQDFALLVSARHCEGLPDLAQPDASTFHEWLVKPERGLPLDHIQVLVSSPSVGLSLKDFEDAFARIAKIALQGLVRRRLYLYFSGYQCLAEHDDPVLLLSAVELQTSNIAIRDYVRWVQESGGFREIVCFVDGPITRIASLLRRPIPFARPVRRDMAPNLIFVRNTSYLNQTVVPVSLTRVIVEGLEGEAATKSGEVTSQSMLFYLEERMGADKPYIELSGDSFSLCAALRRRVRVRLRTGFPGKETLHISDGHRVVNEGTAEGGLYELSLSPGTYVVERSATRETASLEVPRAQDTVEIELFGAAERRSDRSSLALDGLVTVAWPVWAGGYPEVRVAHRILEQDQQVLEDDVRRLVAGQDFSFAGLPVDIGGYKSLQGLTPESERANSLQLSIALEGSRTGGENVRSLADLLQSIERLTKEFVLGRMPGAQEGANLYEVRGRWDARFSDERESRRIPVRISFKKMDERRLLIVDSVGRFVSEGVTDRGTWEGRIPPGAYQVEFGEGEILGLEIPEGSDISRTVEIALEPQVEEPERLRWVQVAGTGVHELPEKIVKLCERIGVALAAESFGLIGGGWQGVDHVVGSAFAKAIEEKRGDVNARLMQVLLPGQQPSLKAGRIVTTEEEYVYSVRQADAIVLIGGGGATFEVYLEARRQDKPIYPLPKTGGDAEKAFRELLRASRSDRGVSSRRLRLLDQAIDNDSETAELAIHLRTLVGGDRRDREWADAMLSLLLRDRRLTSEMAFTGDELLRSYLVDLAAAAGGPTEESELNWFLYGRGAETASSEDLIRRLRECLPEASIWLGFDVLRIAELRGWDLGQLIHQLIPLLFEFCPDEAESVLDRASRVTREAAPTSAELVDAADRLAKRYYFVMAERLYRRATDVSPKETGDAARAYAGLGKLLRDQGEPTAALQMLERAAELELPLRRPAHIADVCDSLASVYLWLGDLERAEQQQEQALKNAPTDSATRCTVLIHMGRIHRTRGDFARAEELFREVLRLADVPSLPQIVIEATTNLGIIHRQIHTLELAEEAQRNALSLSEFGADDRWTAEIQNNLASVLRLRGELEAAEDLNRRALASFERTARKQGMAESYSGIGLIYRVRGDLLMAERNFRRALEINEKMERRLAIADNYNNLGGIFRRRGELDEALKLHESASEINQKAARRPNIADDHNSFGLISSSRGDLKQALRHYDQALAMNESMGRQGAIADTLLNLGSAYRRLRNLEQAEEYARRALAINQTVGRLPALARTYTNLGLLALDRDSLSEAERWFGQAMELDKGVGRREGIAENGHQLGRIALKRGDMGRAQELISEALEIYRSGGFQREADRIQEELSRLGSTSA